MFLRRSLARRVCYMYILFSVGAFGGSPPPQYQKAGYATAPGCNHDSVLSVAAAAKRFEHTVDRKINNFDE